MPTTQRNKPSGKPGQRSRKADQQRQQPDQQQSPKLDPRDAKEQIDAMDASTEVSTNGAVASADAPSTGAAALADVPSIGAVAPADVPSIGAVVLADVPSIGAVVPADVSSIGVVVPADSLPISIQTIANAYGDYTKKSFQETWSFVEKLMGVRSLDRAIEIQTEFARQAYETLIAESQKIFELYSELAKQIFKPLEGFVPKIIQPGR
jgi:phasin family protein